jgi:serine/threonine-protein kinase
MFLEYRLLAVLGEGGMGIVFKAVHEEFDDVVAIKVLSPRVANRKDFAARFKQECKVYPKLKHPHIVRMRRAGVAQVRLPAAGRTHASTMPVAFIVMDLLEGKTLRRILQKYRRLDFLNALHVTIQIADAMRFAHFKQIVHRDLKPENMMVGTIGDEKGYVWVTDFGIATAGADGLSTTDMPDMGTARYMAPEQVRNIFSAGKKGKRRKLDHRIDIYAFGIIFYELLTGRHIFINDDDPPTFEEMLAGHLAAEPIPVHQLVFDCPAVVWPIIARCLAIQPDERYPSFDEVLDDLRALVRDSVPPMHPLAKRVAAEKERLASKAAFASIPEAPSSGVHRPGADDHEQHLAETSPAQLSGDEPAAAPAEPEPSGREALTPEPPLPAEGRSPPRADVAPDPATTPAVQSEALAPTLPAVATRTETPPHEVTLDDAETEPRARPTLPLLNYVPKANPLPFVPAAAPFVPSVPLVQPNRGVGFTTKMERPEIPINGSPARASHTRVGVGHTTKMQRAGVPDVAPPGVTCSPSRSPGSRSPKIGLPVPTLSPEAAFSLPVPPPPKWGTVGLVPDAVREASTYGPLPIVPASPVAPSVRVQTPSSGPEVQVMPSTSIRGRPTPETPASMTTPAAPPPRRRLALAPLLGLLIVLAASAGLRFFGGSHGQDGQMPSPSAAAGVGSTTEASPASAPSAPRAPVAIGSKGEGDVQPSPHSSEDASVAKQSPSTTPVIPVAGD